MGMEAWFLYTLHRKSSSQTWKNLQLNKRDTGDVTRPGEPGKNYGSKGISGKKISTDQSNKQTKPN